MQINTEDKFAKVKTICNNLNFPDGKLTDEYMFTVDATDLVFYKRNIGEIDIKNGFTDGSNDGGIDFVYTDDDTLYLIQGKSAENLSTEDIKNVFNKIADTVDNFNKKETDDYSERLQTAYINAYDALTDDKNIELVLFTNTIIDDQMSKALAKFAESPAMSDYTISIYDRNDLDTRAAILFQDSDLIVEDSIELYTDKQFGSNNILHYGDSGIVINVQASDLKRLYKTYGANGLFSYNLREFTPSSIVDQGIEDTVTNHKDKFWFYNNGITIGCEDFEKDGNRIRLYGFSIINGAQTTTNIGKNKTINEDNDFAIVCKIVKASKGVSEDSDFINKISEASNSQKPIRPRDLKSNAEEQKILQSKCAQNGKYCLAVEIKRGVRPKNYKKVEKWQRVTNEYIGQLLYACVFQHPGPARNGKNLMFTNKELYKQLFLRKHDYNTIYDLVRIGDVYDCYATDIAKSSDDIDTIAVLKNGKFTVLASVIYLVKKRKHLISNASSKGVHSDNIEGLLVSNYPGYDLDTKLDDLFAYIIRDLKDLYTRYKTEKKLTSYSNFFKTDSNYDLVLDELDSMDNYDQEKTNSFLTVFD